MIVIIDYGMGNLRSVQKAFEKVGHKAIVTNNIKIISNASSMVLPGVGAFKDCIKNIQRLDLVNIIKDWIAEGKPFLGICLGLQLLFTESEEFGVHQGLGIVKGKVKRFPCKHAGIKVPHMGWNSIEKKIDSPLMKGIPNKSYFYFVHSYYVEPANKDIINSTTNYELEFVSSISKENLFAVQFHPEKSQNLGLKILKNFGALC